MASFWSSCCLSSIFLLPPLLFLLLLFFVCPNSHQFPNFFCSLTIYSKGPFFGTYNSGSTKHMTTSVMRGKSYLDITEEELARAREAIEKAIKSRKVMADKEETTFVPRGSIYRNAYAFHQSHIEMVKRFKVWTYKEGDPPLVHGGPLQDIYAMEGHFIHEMESNSKFRARRPEEAHAFFLPFTVTGVVEYVYNKPVLNYSRDRLQRFALDYINVVAAKYPFWNRSLGADHFMVSCHDWAPDVSLANPKLLENFIRVLCNANTSEGFRPNKDVSLPELYLRYAELDPPNPDYGPNNRPIFAFFAGGVHGEIRESIFQHWKDKDEEIQVYHYLQEGQNYNQLLRQSRFCLCPSGFQVASAREVEAIYAGCVPVIISDNYTLPFSDVLDWSKFSVQLPVEKIPEMKTILKGVSYQDYLRMQERVSRVRRHFVLHRPSKPFDVFHMVLHSVWLRRLNFRMSP